MRRASCGFSVLGITLIGVTAVAGADTGEAGNLLPITQGSVTPVKLPVNRPAPVTLRIGGKINRLRRSPEAKVQQIAVDFDRKGTLLAEDLPSCQASLIASVGAASAKRRCGSSIVGSGVAMVALAPDQASLRVPLTLFNGGTAGKGAKLLIHGAIPLPQASPVLVSVGIRPADDGAFGLHAEATIQPLPGGASLLSFHLTTKRLLGEPSERRGYAAARCTSERRMRAKVSFTFDDGAQESSSLNRECVPRG